MSERRVPPLAELEAWIATRKPACDHMHTVPSFNDWEPDELVGAYRILGMLSTSPRINGQGLALLRCLSVEIARAAQTPDHPYLHGASPDGDMACATCGEEEGSHTSTPPTTEESRDE